MDVPLPVIRHLIAKYGEAAAGIIRMTHERPEFQTPLAPDTPTLAAEVGHAIRHEQAVHLTDIVIRRTGLGSMDAPGEEAVRAASQLAASELGWDGDRIASEIQAVRDFYRIL